MRIKHKTYFIKHINVKIRRLTFDISNDNGTFDKIFHENRNGLKTKV